MIERLLDWPERLAAAVKAAETSPFVYGEHDCGLFAADVITAMTGVDILQTTRGAYSTEAGCYKYLKRVFGGGVRAACETVMAQYGCPEVPVAYAQRGDVVLLRQAAGDEVVGICLGVFTVAVTAHGLAAVPTFTSGCKAWRV